jgi:hypothetical protein
MPLALGYVSQRPVEPGPCWRHQSKKVPLPKQAYGTHVFDDLRGLEREAFPVKRKAAIMRLWWPRLLAAAGIAMVSKIISLVSRRLGLRQRSFS